MTTNDIVLMNAIAANDEVAMEHFYQRYQSVVQAFALKTLRHPVDAAEVVNEVMMEVWRNAASFSGKSQVRTWLLSITHHKAVNVVRKKSRREKYEMATSNENRTEQALVDNSSPLESVACQQLQQQVANCMNKLSLKHRQVVHLVFYEGLSYSDIAGVLGVPVGTVKTRMMHAKNDLRRCIEKDE